VGFLLWFALTALWTNDPGAGAIAVGTTLTHALLGAALVAWDYRGADSTEASASIRESVDVSAVIIWACTASAAVAVVVGIVNPALATLTMSPLGVPETVWRGLWPWNSFSGAVASIGLVLAVSRLHPRITSRRRLLADLAAIAVLGYALIISGSATWIFATAVGLALALWVRTGARLTAFLYLAPALLIWAADLGGVQGKLFGILGRSPTLSGRQRIWDAALRVGSERWVVGHGAGPLPDYILSRESIFAHFHNAYIQVFVESGSIGLLLLMLAVGHAAVRLVRARMATHFALLATVLVASTANSYLSGSVLPTVVFAWILFSSPAEDSAARVVAPTATARTDTVRYACVGSRRPTIASSYVAPRRSTRRHGVVM
jgi:O-antigen ligase